MCSSSNNLPFPASSHEIPVIDFAAPSESREKLSGEIVDALENVGFLFLENVVGFDSKEIEQATKWFYNLPPSAKNLLACKSFNPENRNHYRGYFPTDPTNSSYKEGYEVSQELTDEEIARLGFPLYEGNQWPFGGEEATWFRDVVSRYYKLMCDTSVKLSSLIARGLGASEDWFTDKFSPFPLSTLRLMNYPPRPQPIPAAAIQDGRVVHCGSHSDSSCITLLATFDYAGLQIEDGNGQWLDVPVRRNSLVVNIGDCLSKLTSYRLKGTKHRVLDLGKQRQSVAFFMEPRFDVNIHDVIVGPGFQDRPMGYGFWLLENYKKQGFVEYKSLVSELAT